MPSVEVHQGLDVAKAGTLPTCPDQCCLELWVICLHPRPYIIVATLLFSDLKLLCLTAVKSAAPARWKVVSAGYSFYICMCTAVNTP